MKLELSHDLIWSLTDELAEQIHARVIHQHLVLIGSDSPEGGAYLREQIRAIRALLRSIPDKWDRRSVAGTIGYKFKALRAIKGTDIRGRDYVARVLAYRAQCEQPEAAPAVAA